MCKYEELLSFTDELGIEVVEKSFKSNAKGLCRGNKVGIRKGLTSTEKACVLAEEIGHYCTTVGNIIDQSTHNNRKQEKIARNWAFMEMVSLENLVDACKIGCNSLYEVAEFLGVTEEFLNAALECFTSKFGVCYELDGYTLYFNDFGYYVKLK